MKVLEVFQGNTGKKNAAKITDEKQREKALIMYTKLEEASIESYCKILIRHPHFNYRLNILSVILGKLATKNHAIRQLATNTLFSILRAGEASLLDFKLEVIKELAKILKQKQH